MNHLQANLCLLCVTFCWSTEVIIFACIPPDVSPFATTGITFLAGGLLLLLCFFRRVREGLKTGRNRQLIRCTALSVVNAAYNIMYQIGLDDFDVSTGAFTLSLTVIALPIIMLVQRSHIEKKTWLSAGIVLIGITAALCNVLTREQIPGLTVIGAGCVLRAGYIIKLNEYAREHDPLVLSTLICLSGGIISVVCGMVLQPGKFLAIPWNGTIIASLAIYAYFVVALTITLNLFAQRRATPANATIIYSLEVVFSVLWGSILPADIVDPVHPTVFIMIGLLCVVTGNIIEIADFKALRKRFLRPAVFLKRTDQRNGSSSEADSVRKERTEPPVIPAAGSPFRVGNKRMQTILLLFFAYFLVAIPFKVMEVIPGFTDVRPVSMLGPVYAVFWGIPGCIVMSLGNLVMDVISDSLRWSSIPGLIANFAGPALIWLYWKHLSKTPFSLRNGRNLLHHIGILLLAAILEMLIITPSVALLYPDVNALLFALSVFLNDFLFPIIFGIPILCLMQEELGFRPLRPVRTASRK